MIPHIFSVGSPKIPTEPQKEYYKKKRTSDDIFPKLHEPSAKRISATIEENDEETKAQALFQQVYPTETEPQHPIPVQQLHPAAHLMRRGMAQYEFLTHAYFLELLQRKDSQRLTVLLCTLSLANCLTIETLRVTLAHKDSDLLYSLTELLRRTGFLTELNFVNVASNEHPAGLLSYYRLVCEAGILTKSTFKFPLFFVTDFIFFTKVIKVLEGVKLLTEMNLHLVVTYTGLKDHLLVVLKQLLEAGRLTQDRFQAVMKQRNTLDLRTLLVDLNEHKIGDDAIWNIAVHHDSPRDLLTALQIVANVPHLMTGSNVLKIFRQPNPIEFSKAFVILLKDGHKPPRQIQELVFEHEKPESCAKGVVTLRNHPQLKIRYLDLTLNHEFPEEFAKAVTDLLQNDLLTEDNLDLITAHNRPDDIAESLITLKQAELLIPAMITLVTNHRVPGNLAHALERLKSIGLLSELNIEAVAEHRAPSALACAFQNLLDGRIFTENNRALVFLSNDPFDLSQTLNALQGFAFLTEENCAKFVQFEPHKLSTVHRLYSRNLLTQELIDLLSSERGNEISYAILNLIGHDILDANSIRVLATHERPMDLAGAIEILNEANVLTQINLDQIGTHPAPQDLAKAFVELHKAEVPTQEYVFLGRTQDNVLMLTRVLILLHKNNILTTQNRVIAFKYEPIEKLHDGLIELQYAGILNAETFFWIKDLDNPTEYCRALGFLQKKGIYTERNINYVINDNSPLDFAIVIYQLTIAELHTKENLDRVSTYPQKRYLQKILSDLVAVDLMTQELWEKLLEHPDIVSYESCLTRLFWRALLTKSNLACVTEHPRLDLLAKALESLTNMFMLTQTSFQVVSDYADPLDAVCLLI